MYLLFDIGGTKTRLAVSKDGKNFCEPRIVSTPQRFSDGILLIAGTAEELSGGKKFRAAVGGIASPLDKKRTMAMSAPNIPGWRRKPLKMQLEEKIGTPVYLENDAALAGLGEATAGAGRGYRNVAYLTVSTGVGGTQIIDGQISPSAIGAEPGHQAIPLPAQSRGIVGDGVCSSHGALGHLEGYVSGSALERRYGKKPYKITNKKVWEEEARVLAMGLNDTIVHWSPDVVVLGGSMVTGKPAISVERVRVHLKKVLKAYLVPPPIKKAALGDTGGLYGALALIRQKSY